MTQANPQAAVYMALELSSKTWKIALSNAAKIREVNVAAGDRAGLLEVVGEAKRRWQLSAETVVYSCYEAGRDGFWIDRWLRAAGILNVVVDSASVEVNRRQRHVKTDRLDAQKLVQMLMRYQRQGERTLWRVVRVPSEAEEDERRAHRERQRLLGERTAHRNRLRSLLVLHGVRVKSLAKLSLGQLRDAQGRALPAALVAECEREQARLGLVEQQLKDLERVQAQQLAQPRSAADRQAARLIQLRGVGPVSALVLAKEFFGWRALRNRRQVGALAGLTGCPYASGTLARDQGISKAGNTRVRAVMIELAWAWLRLQPTSELTQWFWRRFGQGNARARRVGIVAVARKLLVALWRYLEQGEVPPGAVLKTA